MFVDEWGREYKTREEAREAFGKQFREDEDFYSEIALAIDTNEVIEWIVNELKLGKEFQEKFAEDVKCAEDTWCDYRMEELEEIDDIPEHPFISQLRSICAEAEQAGCDKVTFSTDFIKAHV